MPTTSEAVAIARILSFIKPTSAEIAFLRSIPGDIRKVEAGSEICPHDRGPGYFLLLDGWAANSIITERGEEHIGAINLPGDLLGMSSLVLKNSLERTIALTAAKLRWVPAIVLRTMYENYPRLAAITMMISQEERAAKNEWNSLNTGEARMRLAGFMFRIGERLERLDRLIGCGLRIPLKQRQVADAVGVTPVYVQGLLRRFKEQGFIDYGRGRIDLLDMRALQEIACLSPWEVVTPSWLPAPPAEPI